MLIPNVSRLLLTITLFASLGLVSFAQAPMTRIARISLIEGQVSYLRDKDTNNWFDAAMNTPLGEKDQVFTGARGRTEIQLTGRNVVRLDSETSFKISQFTTAVTQIALPVGNATIRIESLDRRQFDTVDVRDSNSDDPLYFEVNTPTVAITLLKTGIYRINVREDGTTEINVRSGEAEIYNQEIGTMLLKKGRSIQIEGNDVSNYRLAKVQDKDAWDRWNDRRDDELYYQADSLSARYIPQGIPGGYDLDRHGDWWHTADYGYVWSPRSVAVGWSPYRVGNWRWYNDYGWTWISTEPWGWTPYHYGSWAYSSNRWCWVPRSSGITIALGFNSWSPARVTFFGWGNNRAYNNGYRDGYRDGRYDQVGWIPLAPGEHYRGNHGGNTIVKNTNIYGNNNTVVNSRVDSFRNHSAPGGLTRMEGRHFDTNRVAVNNTNLATTPLQTADIRSGVTTRGDVFRPVNRPGSEPPPQVNPTATPAGRQALGRQVIARDIARGGEVIAPRSITNSGLVNGAPTLRTDDIPNRDRTVRSGNTSRTEAGIDPSRGENRTDSNTVRSADRGSLVTTRRTERPADSNVERPRTPDVVPSNNDRNVERNTERNDRSARPDNRPYTFGDGNNSRTESAPRRTETERREMPSRNVERPPSGETRRSEPRAEPQPRNEPRYEAPSRSNREERPAPSREVRQERQQEAPRQVERAPQPRTEQRSEPPRSEPSRNTERSSERPSRGAEGRRNNE